MATDLNALEAVLAAATQGEWRATPYSSYVGCPILAQPDPKQNSIVLAGVHGAFGDNHRSETEANAVAIVALHNAAPALIAEHRALLARVEELEGALSKLHHAVCGDTGFAASVRGVSGIPYPWPALDEADGAARAALETKP